MLKNSMRIGIAILLFFASFFNSFSQTARSILILITDPNFEMLAQIPHLKPYHYDDDYLIGEIEAGELLQLNVSSINYQIVDSQGWSGDYYIIAPVRAEYEKMARLKSRSVTTIDDTRAIIKIESSEIPQLAAAGFELEKLSRTIKPLPKYSTANVPIPTQPDTFITKIIASVSAESLAAKVQRLQDFKTRYTYSDSIISAGQWIYDRFTSYGYTDVKFDTFYINQRPHRNVIATKLGLIYPDSVIMLGGHYDSIVNGAGTNPYLFAPGADDNASGTVAALEAARVMAQCQFAATVKFAAWDAEEIGLVGSDAYAHRARANNEPIGLYMNFDMVANVSPRYNVTLYADAATMPLAELTAQIAKLYTALQPSIPGNSGGSDHRSFQLRNYRAFFVQEGEFSPHWHRTSDITANMDFHYMKEVVQMGVAAAMHLAGSAETIHQGPLVKFLSAQFVDDLGNSNGFIDAGESIKLILTVKNYGDSTARQVSARLASDDSYVSIVIGEQAFGSMESQTTGINLNPFVFQVSPNCPSGHQLDFHLYISDQMGNQWAERFKLRVMMPELSFERQEYTVISGNGDDKIDPGELFDLTLELRNSGLRPATGIWAALRCDDPSIAVIDSIAAFSDIPMGKTGKNFNDKFTLHAQPNAKPKIIPLLLSIHEGHGFYRTIAQFNLALGQSKILVVEDDGRFDFSTYYKTAFSTLGIPYYHWNTEQQGMVFEDTLQRYERVVWYTGMESRNSLAIFGTKPLEQYLTRGGCLFINGALFPFSVRDSLIMSQFLHSRYVSFDTRLSHLQTNATNAVLGNIDFWLAQYGDNYQSLRGEIDVSAPAEPILFYDRNTASGKGNLKSSGAAAVAVAENSYRAVMFAFGWEAIESEKIRINLLASILNWLSGTTTTILPTPAMRPPNEFHLLQNYPNPFNNSTIIGFQVPQTSDLTLEIYDVLGHKVKTLAQGRFLAGDHKMIWFGDDSQNRPVASGIYFVRMSAGNIHLTRKIVLMR